MSLDKKLPKSRGVYLPREILVSPAYWQLSGVQSRVLLIFYLKRRIKKTNHKDRSPSTSILNNGEIEFSYIEAKKKYDISKSTFQRALQKLHDLGFVTTNVAAGPNTPAKYELLENWKNYGTDNFCVTPKPKSKMTIGSEQRYGSKSRK